MGTTQPADPVRLRGVIKLDGLVQFSLQCSQGRGSAWVREDQSFYEGRVIGYDSSERSITFVNNEGTWRIPLEEPYSPNITIALGEHLSESYGSNGQNLKPFSMLPVTFEKMPARDLIPLLNELGYEVPPRIIARRESEAINDEIIDERKEAAGAVDGTLLRPQMPKYTTSLTRNQKIAKNLVGYTDKMPSTSNVQDEYDNFN